jgi:hypothetical protein
VAPLLRLRAQGSAAREDAYHLRSIRRLLQRRGRRRWAVEKGGLGLGGGGGKKEGEGEDVKEARAEEQLLLDLVHRIRAPRCLLQVG